MSKELKEKIFKMASWIPFENTYEMNVYVLKFPREIYIDFLNKFSEEKNKHRNMKIAELNSGLKSIYTDIYYTNFIKNSNIEEGWIFTSNPNYLEDIKYHLRLWIESLKLSNHDEEIEDMEFEFVNYIITEDDIRNKNFKSKLFLSLISKKLAEDLNYTIDRKKGDSLDLDFIYVNNDDRFRVLALFKDRMLTVEDKKNNTDRNYYYNYYFELYPINLYKEAKPCIGINIGQLIMSYKKAETVNDINLNPYILINNGLADGEYKATAFKGKILKDKKTKKYTWSKYVDYAVKKIVEKELPQAKDVIENPVKYIDSNLDVSILVPHGTHMKNAEHNVASGVDLKKRKDLLDIISNKLFEYNNFNNHIYVLKDTKNNSKDKNRCIAGDKKYIEFDLLYTNESTKELFEKYIRFFNNKELILDLINFTNKKKLEIKPIRKVRNDISKKMKNVEKNSIEYIELNSQKELLTNQINSLEDEILNYCKILDGIKIEVFEKIFNILTYTSVEDMRKCVDIKINYINYSNTNPYEIKKTTKDKETFRKSLKSLKCNKNLGVSIVELEDKEYFNNKLIVDPKKVIRKSLSTNFNKATKFMTPLTEDSYDKVSKVILDSIRQLGYTHTRDKTYDKVSQIGIIKENNEVILVAVVGKKTYGKFRNYDWMEYNELLVKLASTIDSKDKYEYGLTYIEDSIDDLFIKYNIESATAYLPIRCFNDHLSIIKNPEEGFNLKLQLLDEKKQVLSYQNDKLTTILIDDTIEGEWFKYENNEEKETSFSSILAPISDNLYVSICSGRQGVMQSFIKDNMKINREDFIDKKVFKSEPILMYFSNVSKLHDKLEIARMAHFSKIETSIQHTSMDSGTEETKLPLALHLAIKTSNYIK